MTNEEAWVKHLILSIWDYSISLWKFQNRIVHGTTLKEQQENVLASLHTQVREEYQSFQADPFLVPPQFQSLFLRKPLEHRLLMGWDSLTSWLRSVKKAKIYQQVFRNSLAKQSKQFFIPKDHSTSRPHKHQVEKISTSLPSSANTALTSLGHTNSNMSPIFHLIRWIAQNMILVDN
jgi:hypothetical protein